MKYQLFCLLSFLTFAFFFSPRSIFAHSQIVVIKMTSAGFVPNEVAVDISSTINFVNDDSSDRWPASDLHPTHELYSEFDPKKPVKPGDVFLFKPKKAGVWKFHDHLFPHFKGVLTVTQEEGSTVVIPQQKNLWESFKELVSSFFSRVTFGFFKNAQPISTPVPTLSKDAFKALVPEKQFDHLKSVAKRGSEQAWQFVLQTYQNESGTSGNIHDLAHLSGQLLFEGKGFDGLNLCTPQFAFGCFHGFLDSAFKDDLSRLNDAEKACQSLGSGLSGPVASCIHGIGHGVASFHQTSKLKEALTSCDQLSTNARQYCYDGVFMEFERNAPVSFYKPEKPLYPCDEVEKEYVFSCGRNQPQVLFQRFKKSFGEVASLCLSSKNTDIKASCFDALGFIAATQGKGSAGSVVGLCQQITDLEYQFKCVRAAAGEVVFQEMSNWYISAPQICASLTGAKNAECTAYINQLMKEYGRVRPQTQGENPHTYVQSQMKICLDHGGGDECYQNIANLFSTQFGLKQTLAFLKSNESVPAVYARCHEVTHYLSRTEYEKTKSVPGTYAQCDSTCHGGCYHGTLEAYLKEKQITPGSAQVPQAFRTVCGKPEDHPSMLIYYECMHGLGHAAMFITDMEVPDSLRLCDNLSTEEHRERCYSGVFMENSSSSTSTDHPGKYVRADDPLYPCNSLDEKYQQLCYRYQSSYFALITNHNWSSVVGLCLRVPGLYQNDCFRTIGTNQVGFTSDMKVMKHDCEMVPVEFRTTCFAGVIGSMAYRFVGDITKMREFCSLLDPEHQEHCFANIGSSVVDWTNDTSQRNAFCEQTGKGEYVSWCKQGINALRATSNQAFRPN